jgi:hypothetical protein
MMIIIKIIIMIWKIILDVPCTVELLRSNFEPGNVPLSITV